MNYTTEVTKEFLIDRNILRNHDGNLIFYSGYEGRRMTALFVERLVLADSDDNEVEGKKVRIHNEEEGVFETWIVVPKTGIFTVWTTQNYVHRHDGGNAAYIFEI